jgi:D-tyrosyl-tRNA(Tyr) deacylase
MRAVIQRVSKGSVEIEGELVGSIGAGLVVFIGVAHDDTEVEVRQMAEKIPKLRLFKDDDGKMNRSVVDIAGAVLVISQFTLFGDVRAGNRPGFELAAKPEHAEACYEKVVSLLRATGLSVATGRFRTTMQVNLCNDGPVTILLDSRKAF